MAGAICVRCYSLCISFHYVVGSRTIFGPYFLAPIGLAVALVWLEIGIAGRRRGVMVAASMVPLAIALLATTGHRDDPVYERFLALFHTTLGASPAFVALIAAAVFHVHAVARRVPLSWELLTADLVAIAVIDPHALDFYQKVSLHPLPMVAAGIVLGTFACRGRYCGRALIAAGLLVAALTRELADIWPSADPTMVASQLLLAALMAVGAFFHDWLGQLTRACALLGLLGLGVAAGIHVPRIDSSLPTELVPWYPLCIIATTVAYGLMLRDRNCLAIAGASIAAWLGQSGFYSYQHLRRIVTGLDQIAWGLMFFLIAAAISMRKIGLLPRLGSVMLYLGQLVAKRAVRPEVNGKVHVAGTRKLI
jgi:hypothetical protein